MNRHAITIITFISVMLFAGCSPSEETIQATVQAAIQATAEAAPTNTPEPTEEPTAIPPTDVPLPTDTPEPTPTPLPTRVPLSEIDLESIILRDGELPEYLLPDFVSDELPEFGALAELPLSENYIRQDLYHKENERSGGRITIFVYSSEEQAKDAYDMVEVTMDGVMGMIGESYRDDVGVEAKIEDDGGALRRLLYWRCNALVQVAMITERDFDLVSYGQALEERLAPLVCFDE